MIGAFVGFELGTLGVMQLVYGILFRNVEKP